MKKINITLTLAEQAIMDSYSSMLDGLSNYLGTGYEIVLHCLENVDSSVVKILNGSHTGRKPGAPITDLALEMLSKIKESDDTSYISYFTTNSQGEPLRSTTIAIRGEKNRIIGLLCINFYLNTPLSEIIPMIAQIPVQDKAPMREFFSDEIDDVIENAVTTAAERINADTAIPANMKNRAIIMELYEKGIFNFKDSVPRTAKQLHISKNTVYLHLRNLPAGKL